MFDKIKNRYIIRTVNNKEFVKIRIASLCIFCTISNIINTIQSMIINDTCFTKILEKFKNLIK